MPNLYLIKPAVEEDGEFVLAETMSEALETWYEYEKSKMGFEKPEEPESIMLVQDYIIGLK